MRAATWPAGDHVALTAIDLIAAVRERLAPPPASPRRASSPELADLSRAWTPALTDALGRIEARRSGELAVGRVTASSDYVGAYLTIASVHHDGPVRVWVFVTTADGRYNREGCPTSVCVCLYEPGPVQSPGLHRALRGPLAAPDARRPDRVGETASRVYRASSEFTRDGDPATGLALWVEEVLVESALLAPW